MPSSADTSTAKRPKDPSYVVLVEKIGTSPDEPRRWHLLTPTPIKAPSRKAAIIAAASKDETDGTYAVIPEKDWKPVRRVSRQVAVDEFE